MKVVTKFQVLKKAKKKNNIKFYYIENNHLSKNSKDKYIKNKVF